MKKKVAKKYEIKNIDLIEKIKKEEIKPKKDLINYSRDKFGLIIIDDIKNTVENNSEIELGYFNEYIFPNNIKNIEKL